MAHSDEHHPFEAAQHLEKQPAMSFVFLFPMASGHINPSLPVARSLVALGHRVHYLCREQMREAIEDTGASFHSEIEVLTELYDGREPDMKGAIEALQREFGLESDGFLHAMAKLRNVEVELQMPGLIRWMRSLRACAIMYDPLFSLGPALAGKVLNIPSIALLTVAGPGSMPLAISGMIASCHTTAREICESAKNFEPNLQAIARVKAQYGLNLSPCHFFQPIGWLPVLKYSFCTLVTTSEDLQDPVAEDVAESYRNDNVRFEAVGPLLDIEGAKRAAGHKFKDDGAEHLASGNIDLVAMAHKAKAIGRRVILVSMGTVITGDNPHYGWEARKKGADGKLRGLSGRELCRAAWAGAFDAFGAERPEDGPLLLVAVGPQRDALGDLRVPANVACTPTIPQVDILKVGVDAFLTHGGQNSFTEGLASAAPLVVCPGFADQPMNARKAVDLGVGLQIERPDPDAGCEAAAAAQYQADVAKALELVVSEPHFTEAASKCAERLAHAGGVPRAVEIMLEAGAKGSTGDEFAATLAGMKIAGHVGDSCKATMVGGA